jgi:hypothetical protein
MRTAALTLLCSVAFTMVTKAQRFSLLPQVGFENSRTLVSYNDASSFSPLGVKFSPQASLRFAYATRQGHGFFLGISSIRNSVSYEFTDPETGMSAFKANSGDMKIGFEGGYQFNTRKIQFRPAKAASISSRTSESSSGKRCGSYTRSSCRSSSAYSSRCGSSARKSTAKQSWMRIQPSVGIGFLPTSNPGITTKSQNGQTTYEYEAGNWKTALLAGAGFEFGKNNSRLFTVSLNYFKGLGNLDKQTLTTVSGTKTTTTTLSSKVSGWNLRVGIPFTLGGSNNSSRQKTEKKKADCMQYRIQYRCRTTM